MNTKYKSWPHCDSRIVHSPLAGCKYCDESGLQQIREMWGIAFTGHSDEQEEYFDHSLGRLSKRKKIPCPSERDRPVETIHKWPGNRPFPDSTDNYCVIDYDKELSRHLDSDMEHICALLTLEEAEIALRRIADWAAHDKLDTRYAIIRHGVVVFGPETLSALRTPPVDYSDRTLTDGSPVTDDHREINPLTGQQKGYVVLSAAERAKGFVRPVRRTYTHAGKGAKFDGGVLLERGAGGCGTNTTMALSIAQTYARCPTYYSGSLCASCCKHVDLNELFWEGTSEQVGS